METDDVALNSERGVTDDEAETNTLSQSLKNKLKGFFTKASSRPPTDVSFFFFNQSLLQDDFDSHYL